MDSLLGLTVKDRITGFAGIVTGECNYISGCKQALVTPAMGADGKMPDGQWLDVQRLEDQGNQRVLLKNDLTPGHDKAPPYR